MLATIPLDLAPIPPQRGRRRLRPFFASRRDGPYRPPRSIADRAEAALEGFGNRDAAWRLLIWLVAIHGRAGRLAAPFRIVRAALVGCATLGLTEAQIRGAIATLEKIDAIERADEGGWQVGKPRRRPTLFLFAGWVRDGLAAVNRRIERRRKSPEAGPRGPKERSRPLKTAPARPAPRPVAPRLPAAPDPRLEAALARLGSGVRGVGMG